jgi:hypothetical protein
MAQGRHRGEVELLFGVSASPSRTSVPASGPAGWTAPWRTKRVPTRPCWAARRDSATCHPRRWLRSVLSPAGCRRDRRGAGAGRCSAGGRGPAAGARRRASAGPVRRRARNAGPSRTGGRAVRSSPYCRRRARPAAVGNGAGARAAAVDDEGMCLRRPARHRRQPASGSPPSATSFRPVRVPSNSRISSWLSARTKKCPPPIRARRSLTR